MFLFIRNIFRLRHNRKIITLRYRPILHQMFYLRLHSWLIPDPNPKRLQTLHNMRANHSSSISIPPGCKPRQSPRLGHLLVLVDGLNYSIALEHQILGVESLKIRVLTRCVYYIWWDYGCLREHVIWGQGTSVTGLDLLKTSDFGVSREVLLICCLLFKSRGG